MYGQIQFEEEFIQNYTDGQIYVSDEFYRRHTAEMLEICYLPGMWSTWKNHAVLYQNIELTNLSHDWIKSEFHGNRLFFYIKYQITRCFICILMISICTIDVVQANDRNKNMEKRKKAFWVFLEFSKFLGKYSNFSFRGSLIRTIANSSRSQVMRFPMNSISFVFI